VPGLAPIVRIPSPDPYAAISRADNEVNGVLAPLSRPSSRCSGCAEPSSCARHKGRVLEEILSGERKRGELLE
jgi:4-hydroxy-2-oxoheptanedioate aldolase